jgi:hypothetical protein
MTTTIPSTGIVVPLELLFTEGERIALAGSLPATAALPRRVGSGLADVHRLVSAAPREPFQARRADIECFGRDMESRGRA